MEIISWSSNTPPGLQSYLDVVRQEAEDLLCGGGQDAPAAVGGVWKGQGLSEALKHRATQ